MYFKIQGTFCFCSCDIVLLNQAAKYSQFTLTTVTELWSMQILSIENLWSFTSMELIT